MNISKTINAIYKSTGYGERIANRFAFSGAGSRWFKSSRPDHLKNLFPAFNPIV